MAGQENKSKESIRIDFINAIMYFLIGYFGVFVVDYTGGNGTNCLLYCLWLVIPAVLSFWARESLQQLSLFFIVHIVSFGFCVWIGRNSFEKILFCIFVLVSFFVAYWCKLEDSKKIYAENVSFGLIFLTVPFAIFAKIVNMSFAFEVMLWVCGGFFWLYFLNKYFVNRLKYLLQNEQTAKDIVNAQVKREGNKAIRLFLSVGAVLLVTALQLYTGQLGNYISNGIYSFFRWMLHFLSSYSEEEAVVQEQETIPEPDTQGILAGAEEGNSFLTMIVQWIEKILNILVNICSALFVIGIIALVVYVLYSLFHRKSKRKNQETDYVEPLLREHIKRKRKSKKRFWLIKNTNEKMRKLFLKEIVTYEKEKQEKEKMTSAELKYIVKEEEQPVVEELLPFYQKARYSGQILEEKEYTLAKGKVEKRR